MPIINQTCKNLAPACSPNGRPCSNVAQYYPNFVRNLAFEFSERSTQNLPYSDALFKPERFRKDLQTLTEIFETGEQVEKSEILRQLNLNRKYVKKLTKYDLNAFLLLTLKSFQYSKTHIVAHSTDVIWDFSNELQLFYIVPCL